MSETTIIKCDGDGCGRELKERPGPGAIPSPEARIRVYVCWTPDQDYCPECQRKAWLDYGHMRGWRLPKLEPRLTNSIGVTTITTPLPEPPPEAPPMPPPSPRRRRGAARKKQGEDGHSGGGTELRTGDTAAFRVGDRVAFRENPTIVYVLRGQEGGAPLLEDKDGMQTRCHPNALADLIKVQQ